MLEIRGNKITLVEKGFDGNEARYPLNFVEVLPDGRWGFYLDHHLINTFNTCDAKFKLQNIQNLRPKGPMRTSASLGIWWATTLELYYEQLRKYQAQEVPSPPDERYIVSCAAKAWVDHNMQAMATEDPKHYDSFGGAEGGAMMAVEYFRAHAHHDSFTWRIIGAELGFGLSREVKVCEDNQLVVFYCGRPDLVVMQKSDGVIFPIDHKTVDKISKETYVKYKPFPQTAGYVIAAQAIAAKAGLNAMAVDRCVLNVAARSKPSEKPRDGKIKPRFVRVFPSYTRDELEEWRSNILGKVRRMKSAIETNQFIWRESGCHNMWGGCEYRRIHSMTPGARQYAIKADYVQIEPWVPYKQREEEGETVTNGA